MKYYASTDNKIYKNVYAFDKKNFRVISTRNDVYDNTVHLIIDPLCFPNPCHTIRNITHNFNIYMKRTQLSSHS